MVAIEQKVKFDEQNKICFYIVNNFLFTFS